MGHGTTLNEESSAPVYQHAGELRARGVFATVHEAFWKQEPRVVELLPRFLEPRVFIVPLFISEGYFSEQVIPRELGFRRTGQAREDGSDFQRVLTRGNQSLYYCRPVGTHPSMTGVLLDRALEALRAHPFPRAPEPREITLFIAGHGTDKNGNSRRAIECQAELVRELNMYAAVHSLFLEEEPRISDCYEMAGTRNIVVVPFFISEGLHVNEDIPVLLGEPESAVKQRLANRQPPWRNPTERKGKLLWYAQSVGTDRHMADVILNRVKELAEGTSRV
jgi:sirohydrochlorin cobaltochelatase